MSAREIRFLKLEKDTMVLSLKHHRSVQRLMERNLAEAPDDHWRFIQHCTETLADAKSEFAVAAFSLLNVIRDIHTLQIGNADAASAEHRAIVEAI